MRGESAEETAEGSSVLAALLYDECTNVGSYFVNYYS